VRRGRNEDVFGLDVSVKEVVGVDMLEALHNLEQDALDAPIIKRLVIPRLHQLVQIPLHVLHADVQLFAERVQENVEGRDKVGVIWQGPEKDDFSKFQARLK